MAPQAAVEVDLEAGDGDEVGPGVAVDEVVEGLDGDLLFVGYRVGGGAAAVDVSEGCLSDALGEAGFFGGVGGEGAGGPLFAFGDVVAGCFELGMPGEVFVAP